MHKIREILRLDHDGLSQRDIAASMAIPQTTVGDYLRRAQVAGVTWPLGDEVDDEVLTDTLFGERPAPGTDRPLPDFAHVHRELRRKGVTLLLLWHEYRAEHPDGYAYTQFCEHYRRFVATLHPTMRFTHMDRPNRSSAVTRSVNSPGNPKRRQRGRPSLAVADLSADAGR